MENQTKNKEKIAFGVKFIDPEKIIEGLEISSGMKIADFGSGTGYFTFPLARKVGEEGVVYSLDILKEKIEAISGQAKILGLTNIIAKRVNLEALGGSGLEDGSVDWVILVNMLFQNKDKNVIFAEAKRVLREKGKILVIEWNDFDSSIGPERKTRVSKEEMEKLVQNNSLSILKELTISDFHYGLVLAK